MLGNYKPQILIRVDTTLRKLVTRNLFKLAEEENQQRVLRSVKKPVSLLDIYSCFDKGCPTSVKAYATMPIGVMGSKSLALLDCIEVKGDSATRNEKKRILLCCFLPPLWETLGSLKKNHHYP